MTCRNATRWGPLAVLGLLLIAAPTHPGPVPGDPAAPDRHTLAALPAAPATPPSPAHGDALLGRQPLAFVPNRGQWDGDFSHRAQMGPMTVFLQERGWTFTLEERRRSPRDRDDLLAPRIEPPAETVRGVAVRMSFNNFAAPATAIEEQRLPGVHNYFLGNDPERWRTDLPLCAAVLLADLYPGIDVRARSSGRHFEYDLLLAPGAELSRVAIEVEGAEGLALDPDGALVIRTALGPVRQPLPRTWQVDDRGRHEELLCRYRVQGDRHFGFEAPERDDDLALVVDPGLVYSTHLGSSADDRCNALAVDATGAVTLCGETSSPGFPTTLGAYDTTYNGGGDAFVTRLDASGTALVWSTFIGGSNSIGDGVSDIALDATGAATICGSTGSADFPVTAGAFDTSLSGMTDCFVTRIDAAGNALVWSTFLGGGTLEGARALALQPSGAVTLCGSTSSLNFPVTPGAFDTTPDTVAAADAFVTRLNASGSALVWSTYLGDSGNDWANDVVIDATGAATVCGDTFSTNFPTTPGALDTTHGGGGRDGFVTRLNPSGSALVWSTFLGGLGWDHCYGLGIDDSGAMTVCGSTDSLDFPTTTGAFDEFLNGGQDAFVTRIDNAGSTLLWSTYLGGVADDSATSLAVDASGGATVAGTTVSTDFPVTAGAFGTSSSGLLDCFVSRLDAAGSQLFYSSYLGGSGDEDRPRIALDASGAATLCGWTDSADFPPSAQAPYPMPSGGKDGFVTRLDMLPTGATAFGGSTAGCAGFLPIGVTAMPQVGNLGFALTCANAQPLAAGVLAISDAALPAPQTLHGAQVLIDLTSPLRFDLQPTANNLGAVTVPLPIPADPGVATLSAFAQFGWPDPCLPGGLATSNALALTIQP